MSIDDGNRAIGDRRQATILFADISGFTAMSREMDPEDVKETMVARRFFAEMGLDSGRVIYEDRSRNTFENAVYTYDLVKPAPGEKWILITSAYHMARSVGVFRNTEEAVDSRLDSGPIRSEP